MTDKIDISPEAVAAMLDGVTPGPWAAVGRFVDAHVLQIADLNAGRTGHEDANARFIAWAREAVPALAAEAAEAKLVKALEPDYCYDDEWEYTMPYDQWPELFDGAEVGTVHALHTLIKGPTFYVVEVPVDTNGDGEPDDWEWRKFNSREEADAFLAEIGEGHE